ncbi:MAG TPA: hypothetical protein ENN39_10905 [Desulfonatronum sp.]|nr:hypothetical protein [Desulfonatronum sp.]
MSHILAVRIPVGNRLYFYHSGAYVMAVGDHALVHVEGDLHMGRVERISPMPEPLSDQDKPVLELPDIFRAATAEDLDRDRENRDLSRKAYVLCRRCIQERALDMKLVDVVVLFDGSKILFFFTAPNRIDFRELVKDLVRAFRTRIELRQIGARHETQMVGGIGNCGQLVCCQRFLRHFAPSTIKMAKEQNLFLNPAKISGVCNRLLCCLSYEQANYEEFLAQCPKIGKKFSTALGSAKVIRANYFRRTLNVWLESEGEREIDLEEWFTLVGPGRTASTVTPDPQVKARVVEPAITRSGQLADGFLGKTSAFPQEPFSEEPKVDSRAVRDESLKSESSQAKDSGRGFRGKTKKEGKTGSRKTKRRPHASRNRSQHKAKSSTREQNRASGKTQKKTDKS